jgi:peptidyl-prolyl cis-trans isomerase C
MLFASMASHSVGRGFAAGTAALPAKTGNGKRETIKFMFLQCGRHVKLENSHPFIKEKSIAVKSLTRFVVPSFCLIFAGMCFPQASPKAQDAPPKAGAAASASASKAQASEAPKGTTAEGEAIPPAGPNALFPAVVAKVDGKPILGKDLEQLVRGQLTEIGNPEWKDLREDYRGQLIMGSLTTLINSKLIYEKAVAGGIKATDAEVQAEMQQIAKSFQSDAEMNSALASQNTDRATLEKNLYQSVVISKYVEENVNKKVTVTQEELAKYYSEHPTEFQHPEIVRTSQILIRAAGDTTEQDTLAKQRAEALLARIKKGEDFSKLARENSVDASASQGGDIGFYSRDALAPEYSETAFSLPVGGVKLAKSQFGYHIIKVTEKKKEGLSTLEEVKEQLTVFLKNQKAQADLAKLINQLRDQAKVDILIPAGQPLKP